MLPLNGLTLLSLDGSKGRDIPVAIRLRGTILIKQPMKRTFKRYVDQITQNVIVQYKYLENYILNQDKSNL